MRKNITIALLSVAIMLLLSCSKSTSQLPPPVNMKCERVCLLSDKYRADSSYITTDTLWGKNQDTVCGRWLDTMIVYQSKGDIWYGKSDCPPIGFSKNIPIQYECHRYVVGNRITYPKILKRK